MTTPEDATQDPAGTQVDPHAPISRYAIASLVASLLAPFTYTLSAFAGMALGIVAIRRIHRLGQRGTGLAFAGIIVGIVMVVVLSVVLVLVNHHVSHKCANHSYTGTDYQHFCVDNRGPLMSR